MVSSPVTYKIGRLLSFLVISSRSSHAERDGEKRSLTEGAVDDFARAQKIFKGKAMPAARIVYRELAARRRSLAPVR
jgi:hypothetical protein